MMLRFTSLFRVFLMMLAMIGMWLPARPADWPAYMKDVTRSGVTTDTLTLGTLAQQWVYSAPAAPVLAWPEPQLGGGEFPKVKFDDAFYAIGVGDIVYFGSSVDNKIYALDADDGSIIWSYYTGGAVRTAPTVSGGYLYAASDDGYAYCLNATTGAFVWKYSALETPQYQLGMGRMVSKRPSRTGVMVSDGTVYFGYGSFRANGIGLTARNASDGSQVWLNTNGAGATNDFSPQGYPLMTSTRIIAPSGRYLPSLFNRSTGAYVATAPSPSLPRGTGSGVYLALGGDTFYVGNQNLLRAYDASTAERREALDWASAMRLIATASRYYILQGLETDGSGSCKVMAYDRSIVDAAGNRTTTTLDNARLWTFTQAGLDSMILTGNYVVVGGSGKVYALDVTDGSKDWEGNVNGRAAGLMVANSQLYVSTDTGKIYCFGNGTPVNPTTPNFVEPFPNDDDYEDAAAAIVAQAGFTSTSTGYCLVTGSGTAPAKMAYNIAKRTNLRVHCALANAADVLSTRQALDGALVYGTRVAVDEVAGTTLPYPDYCANLVVHVAEYGETTPSGSELLRVTKPCGGWLMYGPVTGYTAPAPSPETQTLWDADGDLTVEADDDFLQGAGEWYLLERGTLAGAGSWTHQNANAANTGSSEDQWVRGTLGLLWYGDPGPGEAAERHLRSVAPLSHNGRVFHQAYNVAADRNYIICYDAYNGTRNWETTVTGAFRYHVAQNSGSLACNDDYLFVVAGAQCKRLDVATGQISATYNLPAGCTEKWGYLAVTDGLLLGSESPGPEMVFSDGLWKSNPDYEKSNLLFARDIVTGDLAWTYSDGTFRNNVVAISDGRVFLIEQRAGQTGNARTAVALDLTDGDLVWEKVIDVTNTGGMTLVKNGVLIIGVVANPYGGAKDPNRRVVALATADGATLWDKAVGNTSRLLVMGNTLIAQPSAYHLISGEKVMLTSQTAWSMGRSSACGAISASASLLFFREGIPKWFDYFTQTRTSFLNMRPGCWINIVPAGGVVVQPDASSQCRCYYSLQCAVTYKSTATAPNSHPTVSLTEPTADAVFNGAFTITATASDSDGTIGRVEFYANGSYLGSDSTSPFSYAWAAPPPASYALTAKAYDKEGGSATSVAVNVRVNNPPTVTITAPAEGNVNGVINITATASDTDGAVSTVEFYADGTYLGVDSTSPYAFSWASAPYGAHVLTVNATDNDGGVTTSAGVAITQTNNAPTVSLTAPTDLQRFASAPATINITANAADSGGSVSKVEFYQGTTKLGEDASSPYSYNWTNVAAGAYTLTAKASDNLNVYTLSTAVRVNVGPNINPTVSLTAPTDGMAVIGNTLVITANAADADGYLTKVEFYDGGAKIGEDTSSPYTFDWTGGPFGSHTLTAKAIDNESASTTSSAISVTVWNNADIGNVGTTGSASYSSGEFTVNGAGAAAIKSGTTADAFHYVFHPISGDCTIVARITSMENTTSNRGGVMIRETLDANAKHIAMTYRRDTPRFYSVYRTTTGGSSGQAYVAADSLAQWVKIVRAGNNFKTYYSANGSDWTQQASQNITMSNSAYIGMATSSGYTTVTRWLKCDNVTVTGANLLPDVGITSPAGGARYASAPANITLTASAADTDGTISMVEFYHGTTKLGEDTTSPYSYDWTNVADDDYSVTAVATDNAGAITMSRPVTIHVGPNHLPSVSLTAPEADAVFNGDISMTATASDTDGTISTVEFYVGTTKLGEDATSPYAYTWVTPPVGTHALTAKAIDNEGGSTLSTSVNVRENAPPTVSLTAPESDQRYTTVPADITITAETADTDGAIGKVEFYQGATKLGEDTTSPYGYAWNGVGEGEYTLTAVAIDNDNRTTTSAAIVITVVDDPNIQPTVSITAPDDEESFNAPANITITADADDADGMITRVEFHQGTTKLGEDEESPYSYAWNNVAAGDYVLTAKAFDDGGAFTTSAAIDIHVTGSQNTPPSVTLTAPADGTVIVGNSYTLTATASDSDGTITKMEFYQGTTKLGEDSTSPYSYDWTSITGGVYAITAKAIDDDADSTVSSAAGLTVWNNADVGNTGVSGSASYASGEFTVNGAGAAGIKSTTTADAFHYVYQLISGDCTIVARITSMENTTSNRGGIMIRETLNGGSKHMAMTYRRDVPRFYSVYRTSTDGTSGQAYVAADALAQWVKIVRAGNNFKTYSSANGSDWTQRASQDITMNSTVYIGIATSSNYSTVTRWLKCDNVSVTTQ